ncbi:hypothetical protein O3P69_015659 [Scylla paramamosain]|uniref:Uncharacterized protein n=1 Tax=Scylla paramamosain TaxID=85552 RepID=A0AAW0SK32_SCYPA
MHLAALGGCAAAVQWLVQRGCDPHVQSKAGLTPLELAVQRGRHEVESWLVKNCSGVVRRKTLRVQQVVRLWPRKLCYLAVLLVQESSHSRVLIHLWRCGALTIPASSSRQREECLGRLLEPPPQLMMLEKGHVWHSFELFRGGPAVEQTGQTLSITVVQGRTATVLEVQHTGVDFATL